MAQGDILSLFGAADGATLTSNAGVWVVDPWTSFGISTSSIIYLISATLSVTASPPGDATAEVLLEIGKGSAGSQVIVAQIPFSIRNDTVAGFFPTFIITVSFPEMPEIAQGEELWWKISSNGGTAATFDGTTLLYLEGVSAGNRYDPFGSFGFFGL